MARTSTVVDAPPQAVWDTLADGWLYATWVVGAVRIREVDPRFPAEGSTIAHSVGLWPLLLDDTTRVLVSEPPRRLVLQARGWPLGEATVDVTLAPEGDGTRVDIAEEPTAGPGALAHNRVVDAAVTARLTEMLRRLRALAEGRRRRDQAGGAVS